MSARARHTLAAFVNILVHRRGTRTRRVRVSEVLGAVKADPRHTSNDADAIADLVLDIADRFAPEVDS